MIPPWVQEAVKACKLPPSSSFPRRMDKLWMLPVTVVRLPGLTTQRVEEWFSARQLRVEASTFVRELHGCMVAQEGKGFLFYDPSDSEEVQTFTLAHEIGHFVLDHLLPRAKAVEAQGKSILPVLNGRRPATTEESLSAVLSRAPLNFQIRLMDRSASRAITQGRIDAAEYRADRVAFELLAPAEHVWPRVRGLPRAEATAVLKSQFGLPPGKARTYARRLLGPEKKGFSLREYLGMEEEE
jgi:hypothetical protein